MPITVAAFKSAVAKRLTPPGDGRLWKSSAAVHVESAGARRKRFTLSTASIDRDNDKILQAGWDLKNYMANPIVLWSHDASAPPIGRSVEIGLDGDVLRAIVEFVPEDVPIVGPLAEAVYRMCDLGFLSTCSVGFRPVEYAVAKDRMGDDDWLPPVDFIRQELWEWSVCTVPANPEAVIDHGKRRAPLPPAKMLLPAKKLPPAPPISTRPACYLNLAHARDEADGSNNWLHSERSAQGALTAEQRAIKTLLESRRAEHRAHQL